MAANLLAGGYLSCVWNRSPERLQRFCSQHGVEAGATPAALAGAADVLIVCVSADVDLLEVIEQLLPALSDRHTVVDCSTVSQSSAENAAARVAATGAAFIDAPVSGGVEGARQGTLVMMAGGDADALDKVRPALQCMARRVEHMGAVGSGQATKAVNQIMAAGINQAVTEALAFARACELPTDRLIDLLSGGAAGNWFLEHRGPSMVDGRFDPGFKVALHHKDLAICQAMAEQFGVALPIVEMTLVHYRRLMEAGHGGEDISALFREKLRLFPQT